MRRLIALSGAAALLLAFGPLGVRGADEPRAASEPKAAPDASDSLDIQSIVSQARSGTSTTSSSTEKKYKDFAEVTRGAEKINGLFTLHRKDEHLYAEIKPQQFDQPLLMPITIAKGLAQAGIPVGESDMVLVFRKVGDRVQLVRRNIRFKAPAGTPLDKSVKQNYVDSVLLALPIVSVNPAGGMSTLVDLSEIFLTNFAELPFGSMDRSRSNWHQIKGFSNNLELEVETTFTGGRFGLRGDDGVPDSRGITLVVHYSLMKAPDMGYKTRLADDRVGHFLDTQKDFGLSSPDSNYVRHINRWRLEKADPKAKLSPPKKQIVWWIEDTVPIEYRPYVEAGILEWNKAFEAVGIRSALAVRWQDGRDDFDPEDANYCTFRWVTSDAGFARSCFRTNPMTGEIIDGDVVFDASFIRHWKQEYALLVGSRGQGQGVEPLAIGEVISPIMAAKYQYGQLLAGTPRGIHARAGDPQRELIPADWGPLQYKLTKELARTGSRFCGLHSGLSDDFGIAALALADAKKADAGDELPEDFIGQALKSVVMHEVGHSLGLRHNFKASTMLTADQLNDTTITHKKGLVGSVMDYSPVNIAPKGKTQGDYYTTTLGPYDLWAIEYAYKAIDGSEEAELKKIASRAPEADLSYATDEDMSQNKDPQVNVWDLGHDPCMFAKERISLATRLLNDLDDKVVKDGESWARNRRAFSTLMNQWGNASHLVSAYIGGQSIHRDHKGDKGGRDPIVPISGAKQRDCLKFLVENILSDQAFQFSPTLLRRLGSEKWLDWSTDSVRGDVDFPVLERVLAIQKIALGHCLSPSVLARLQNQELQADPGTDPLRMDEVFRALTDGIWSELNGLPFANDAKGADAKGRKVVLSTIRRNLQREHLRRLGTMVLGERRGGGGDLYLFIQFSDSGSVPADARALARLHLKEIHDRIGKALDAQPSNLNDTGRAHLEESRQRISKILDSSLNVNEL